jgi:excisionase family DNA binding protein
MCANQSTPTPIPSPPPQLLDVETAANYLGITVHQLRDYRRQRKVEVVKLGRRLMFRKEALDTFIKNSTLAPIGAPSWGI